jgi:hypothetical protein
MKTKPIETIVGKLMGRNALYLDDVKQLLAPPSLIFRGALSAPQCSNYQGTERFPAYEAVFEGCQYYDCTGLDYYKREKYLSSSFDLVVESDLVNLLKLSAHYNHYVFATYDFVYEVVAKSFVLDLK